VKARLLTITLALVVGIVGVAAVLAYVRQANERAINGLRAETVVVANGAIPAGTSLSQAKSENLLGTEKVPVSSVSPTAVQSVTTANEHMVVSSTVAQGQVLLQNMLAKSGTLTAGSYAELPLPKGDIGVTIQLCLGADVAGYVHPGSYIAVFDTFAPGAVVTYSCTSHQAPPKAAVQARIIVARVEVLSVTPVTSEVTTAAAGQLAAADLTNPASPVFSSGEVFVTLAATSQTMAENLVLITSAGDPTFGLLTTGSKAQHDGPYNGNLQPNGILQP
jgi:pilus assembly protein CpaB